MKHKKPTERQENLALKFKSGSSIAALAWIMSDGTEGSIAASEVLIENAIRTVMLWQRRNERP